MTLPISFSLCLGSRLQIATINATTILIDFGEQYILRNKEMFPVSSHSRPVSFPFENSHRDAQKIEQRNEPDHHDGHKVVYYTTWNNAIKVDERYLQWSLYHFAGDLTSIPSLCVLDESEKDLVRSPTKIEPQIALHDATSRCS